tara:strand:- start:2030 stop:2572 length:543 start_codon:yes stop_codon:yes gene_type:complete
MAKGVTSYFFLNQTVTLPAANASGTFVQAEIDIASLVNAPKGQALEVEMVDFTVQRAGLFTSDVESMVAGNGSIDFQLTDLNPGTKFVRGDSQSLIASGSLNIDQTNCIGTYVSDLYPDSYGKNNGFMVVNETLYLNAVSAGTAIGANDVYVNVRMRVRVVKLTAADWTSIALQSVSSDQ